MAKFQGIPVDDVQSGGAFGGIPVDDTPQTKPSRSVSDIIAGGIGAIADDIRNGIDSVDKRKRQALIERAAESGRQQLSDARASGTSAELERQAQDQETANSARTNIVSRGVDFARDLAVSGAQGVVGLGESVVGLGDLATGWTGHTPGQFLKDSVGYDPDATKQILGDLKSDAGKARDAIYQSTKGFTDTLLTLGSDPGMLADKIAESLAGTVGAGAIGQKAVQIALPRLAAAASAAGLTGEAAESFIADKIAKVAIGSAAAGEGVQQAGNLAETARQGGKEWKDYALPAVASGAGTAVIAAASGGMARKLGIGDVEADIAMHGTRGAGVKTAPGFWVNRAAVEGIKEGVLEEMPQSVQEAAWENVAMGRPWDQGLGKAAASGLATGAGMGAGHAAVSRGQQTEDGPGPKFQGEPVDGVNAADVLGTPENQPTSAAAERKTEAEKALFEPKSLTALDRVAEIDAKLQSATPEESPALHAERDRITETWPKAVPGAATTFSTESGAKLQGEYALMEAGDLTTSHDENLRPVPTYPSELQPRERERHASELQVQQIVQKLDPARLGVSADAATGAPIVGADGLVESGNARSIALKRVYQANGQKAQDYRQFLRDNAQAFGIDPAAVETMERPILVRVRTTPVNRAEFARQANASTVARMSPSEQARADAAMVDSLDDLQPDEYGDFMGGTSRGFVRRFLAKLPTTEQGGMIDSAGNLSQAGYARIRNAVLAKAYGDSPVLLRMVESLDDNTRNLTKALMRVAPQVAKVREAIGEGALFDVDITPDLLAAVEELSDLKERGVSVDQALAQAGMFGDKLSPESRELLSLLNDNIRSPRRIAEFIQAYMDALVAAGSPAQGSMFGDTAAPTMEDLLAAARRTSNGESGTEAGGAHAGGAAGSEEGRGQSQAAPRDQAGNRRNEAPRSGADQEWVAFPPDSGTLGIPRAEMPQIKGEHRGALIQFLDGRGITHKTIEKFPSEELKPTQAEFSMDKARSWGQTKPDTDRSVLISSDGYVLDGHHQWVAARAAGEPIKAIQFSAPIRTLLAAVEEFPSVKRSEGATTGTGTNNLRELALKDFNSAMDDLGAVLRDMAGVARVVPEDTPGLMDTLVKLFDAALRLGYHDAKKAVAYVKEQLKGDQRFKTLWNKISNATYLKAAAKAVDQAATAPADDLFAQLAADPQPDLFSSAPASQSKKGNTMTIDGAEYDADASHFGFPEAPKTLKAGDPLLIHTNKKPIGSMVIFRGTELTRGELHELIEDDAFSVSSPAPQDRKPIAYVMGGGGASGKGTVKNHLIQEGVIQAADAVSIDPDEIKREIPEYGAIVAAGDSRAAAVVHEESSDIAKRIQDRAIKGRYDIILDVTLGDEKKGMQKLQELKDAGYEVRLYGVTIQPEIAVVRAMQRAQETGRYVPIDPLLHAHKGFSGAFERYADLADEARLYENSDGIENVAEKVGGKLEIKDPQAYNEIAERRFINERATTLGTISRPAEGSGRLLQEVSSGVEGSRQGDGSNERRRRVDGSGQVPDSSGANGAALEGSGVPSEAGDRQQGSSLNVQTDRGDGADGAQGKSAGTARRAPAKRKTQSVRPGEGGGNRRPDDLFGASDGGELRVQQDRRPDGESQDHERRAPAGAGDRAVRAVGVPAGRDIPAKTGRNYRFSDSDLTYEGGWAAKARQNVEAVELIKKLEAEGRQASREEQAVLAKFIGWGASEIRNSIFGDKLDKAAAQIESYARARKAIDEAGGEIQRHHREYYFAFDAVRESGLRYGDTITRAALDKAKPDTAAKKWIELRDRLKAAMTPEEWATAERSTQYAHYTSKAVVQSMWKAMERMGFKGGAVFEPGAGIGVFPGLMPAAMATNSAYTGIEMDAISGAILKQLLPDERVLVESFVDTALPDDFYDAAVGNPPFANIPILSDPKYKKHAFSLHDYFFAKSIDKVKPGGLMVYVTSRYTMDKLTDKARKYLADRADLVGAIRLPQTAFMKNAGTEVVTDVLFLRKKVSGETFAHAQDWMKVDKVETDKGPANINEYFIAHPEMVLGTHSLTGSMYAKNEYTVLPRGGDIEAQFAAAVENLPADVYRATGTAAEAAQVREIDFNPKAQKEGNYYVSDAGVLMQREGGVGVRADAGKPEKTVALLKDFIGLRDALKQAHYDQLNDGPWEESLKALQKAYRAFVKKHGNILQNKAFERIVKREDEETGQEIEDTVTWRRFDLLGKINDDPDYTLVEALETLNEETGEIRESKFLHERVLAKSEPARIETPHDALLAVLNDVGEVDMPAIAERLGISQAQAATALGSAVYESPDGGWQMADEYLSGNVKKKLREAQEAAKSDRRYERNIEALLSAQPSPVPPSDITPAIGMNWIPADVYEQFLKEKTGVNAKVSYNERTGDWTVTATSGYYTPAATMDWGTQQRNAADILETALSGRPIRITRTEGSGNDKKTVFDAAATEAANQKLTQMRNAFAEWLWQDGKRADELTRIYNDKFNTIVPRRFDGEHLTLPGTTTTIKVFPHVKRGAWRIIQTGNTYLAHAVGSGKTWQMVISAMEQKRLGLIQKPMVVVPNHMLQQFAREWLQLYPAARLMVADEKQFHTENRRRFVSRVAMSDLDGVIITHSAFKLLDLDPEFKRGMIEEQLDYLRAALEEAGGEEGKKSRDPKVRDIQNRIEKMEQKLEAAMSSSGKDKNVRFDQLGVDFLYVDEAHEYRKLAFTTQRQVKGIDSSGSDRAFDLFMKTRWLEQKRPGRSLVMASGTPVTNTLAELYTVQRFMAPDVLEERGLQDFDSWAAMFGQENTEIEADASGRYSPVTRFTKFVNVPELTQMFREYADVVTAEHLAEMLGDKRPRMKGGSRTIVVTPQTDGYTEYKKELVERMQVSKAWKPSRDEPNNPDPIIKIIGDGRLAAIDMRFVDPSLPSDPDSKLNQMIDGVIEAYKRTADNEYLGKDGKPEPDKGGAQMVFSDLGFGAGVAEHRGFNARAWVEKRLREAGIPAKQVAFMSDFKKSTAKLKLFQDVNAGRVRILFGSSKNMGTGVNAQQRLVALHHLDTPWYPADLEQREGRIIRQGNKNPLVEIYAYSTKGSYDTVMWQMLASKQRFIDQALSGDSSVRSIDDLTEASQYQIATAMTAGDPRAIQLAGLKADIEKLQRLFRAHEETRARVRQDYELAGAHIKSAEKQLPQVEKEAAKVQDLTGDNFKAKADGKTFDKRKEWGEALLAVFKDYSARAKEGRIEVGEIYGFPVEFVGKITRDSGGKVKEYETALALTMAEGSFIMAWDQNEDPVGMATRAANKVASLARVPGELRQRIVDANAKRTALVDRLDAKFQFAQELADKLKEADELEAAMVAQPAEQNGEKPGQNPAEAEQTAAEAGRLSRSRTDRSVPLGRGMLVEDVRAVVDGFRKSASNLPGIHVLQHTKDAPRATQKWLREHDAMEDAAGLFHDGELYMFASHLNGVEHAQQVFLHEAQHYGLRGLFGQDMDPMMLHLYQTNAGLKKKADARVMAEKESGRKMSVIEATEETLADMAGEGTAKKLNGWNKLVAFVRDWFRKAGWIKRVTDNDVAYLIHRAGLYWKRAQQAGYGRVVRNSRLSRASQAPAQDTQTTAERAEAIINRKAATARPLDAVLRGAAQAVRLDKATGFLLKDGPAKAMMLAEQKIPGFDAIMGNLRAGLVSDYGIPEAVIDRRSVMEGRKRQETRGAGALIEKLSTMTRAESRVAYEWLNNDDPQAAAYFEQQLPEESVKILREVRDMVDSLSKEAVRLGQLDKDAYERNRLAYLHRSYVKHTAELTKGESKSRTRAISILGDQYKGRGMTDAADMARIKNIAPEWWNRKLRQGKADTQLKGEQFLRLERRAHSGEGTSSLAGFGERGKGRLLEVAYWPAGEAIPAKYSSWDQAGTWEVRGTKGAKVILWRDFTKQERVAMGEIDEARYAIAKTLHNMINDVETGRYLEWLGQRYGKKEGEEIDGEVVEASERMRDTFKPGEWVKVPDSLIPGTKVKKYGNLAGRYLPGPIWNDVRQVVGFRYSPLGETYAKILSAWKTSKTALSPAVHMNNVMANFVMADWHDVTAGHILKALRLMTAKDAASKEVMVRYGDSGGTIGTWATKELQQEQLRPLLDALEKELGIAGNVTGQVGVMATLQLALRGRLPSAMEALKPTKGGQAAKVAARAMLDLYEAEDQVFRLAAWLKAKEGGASDLDAGKVARKSFLDYNINAPWVQMLRSTAFPFIAFTYRSVPMLLDVAAHKPWKLLKLGLIAGAANWLGYLLSGGDEDDERKLLPEEKAGRIWGITPKLIRMPWNDAHGSPVFLDVRRWIPVGDVFDIGQSHSALPTLPSMVPGGPLAVLAELALNKQQFSGKEITQETDTGMEKAQKVADYLYKAFAPNIAILPGTYAWTGIVNAGTGRTDTFGREQSLAQAIVSSVGVKVGSYPGDVLRLNAQREAQAKLMEIDRNVTALKRERQKNGLTDEEFQQKVAKQWDKKRKVVQELQDRLAGR